jgi:hypothetical protein
MVTTPPNKARLLATYLSPEQCRENALGLLAKAMRAKDRRSANRFKKAAETWERLAEELHRSTNK